MGKDTLSLGDRMKQYEHVFNQQLPPRQPVIIRLDGKAFHTFTRGLEKPFDNDFIEAMQKTTQQLCENTMGCKLAYTQSDEITLVLTNNDTYTTQPLHKNKIQKLVSTLAAQATLYFNQAWTKNERTGIFDARAFTVPNNHEVINNLYWRQLDWMRNSIQMQARAHHSQKQVHGRNCTQLTQLLKDQGHNPEQQPNHIQYGTLYLKPRGEPTQRVTELTKLIQPPLKTKLLQLLEPLET